MSQAADIGYFDGACEPCNPGGTVGWGFVLLDADGKVITEGWGRLNARPDRTNNVAEYLAAGKAVKAYKESGRSGPLVLRGDSQLVVKQMLGEWAARGGAYLPLYNRLTELVLIEIEFEIRWEWIPREENARADALSVRALEEAGIERRQWR